MGDYYSEGGGAGHGGKGYDVWGLPYRQTYGGFAGGSGGGGSGGNIGGGGGGGGGGALAIDAAGAITLNGAIRANGGQGVGNPGGLFDGAGGSGGQVLLAAPTIYLGYTSDVVADDSTTDIEANYGAPITAGNIFSGGGIVQFYTSTGTINVWNPVFDYYFQTNNPNLLQVNVSAFGAPKTGQPGIVSFGTLSFNTTTNVSSDVSVTRSGFRYDFVQTITITNTSSSALVGSLALQLSNLSSNATLANASGTNNGDPYIDFVSPSGSLERGESVTVMLYFKDPTFKAITYGTQVWQGF